MANTFTINGKKYTAKPFDFNLVCDLEEAGVPVSEMKKKPTATARAYFALCYDGDKEDAGTEIEQHMINGGDLKDLMSSMMKEMNASDFFQALSKNKKTKTSTVEE